MRKIILILAAMMVLAILSGCYTKYYPDGTVQEEGFTIGTKGLGSYTLVEVNVL